MRWYKRRRRRRRERGGGEETEKEKKKKTKKRKGIPLNHHSFAERSGLATNKRGEISER